MTTEKPLRHVRSFVRREGRMTDAQKTSLETLWPIYGVDVVPDTPLDFAAIFGRVAPVVLEIGFGMGHSLLHMALAHPEWNFLGIEVHRPGVGRVMAQLQAQQVNNVRVMCADAVEVLNKHVVDGALDRVLVFFPDPWPKTRHHKRRLIQPEFVALLSRKLRVGGALHLATDWQHYAEHMLQTLSAEPSLRNLAPSDYTPRPDYRPLTKFEQRGQRLGHGIWDLMFERI